MAQLANIERTVEHPLATVWQWLSNFGEIGWTGADNVDVIGEGIGTIRRINMAGLPEPIDEVLESMDHEAHSFSYTIPRGLPLPLDDYRAVVQCSDAGDGKTLINWQCHAKPGEGISEADAKALISDTYDSLITGLVTAIEKQLSRTADMAWQHRFATINSIRMHWVEEGDGMPVLLCHGFPQTWFCWHRQITVLAEAGYRVIAPDMRGMGDSEAPEDLEAYGCGPITGDLLGLLDYLGIAKAVIGGVDFGAFAAQDFAQRHPDRVIALLTLENPAAPHNPETPPLTEYAEMAKKHFLHIEYFREPGPADRDLNAAPYEFLTKVFYALSGDYHYLDVWKHPPGTSYLEALPEPPPMPWPWLSALEMETFVAAYARSGFTGGLNYYRAMDIKWRDRKPYEGVQTDLPAYFIGSEQDPDLEGFHGDDPVALLRAMFPDLRRVEMVANAGHMLQLEQTGPVNALLLEYLAEISASQ